MKVVLKNMEGVTKEVKVGYSWTTLFFGALVPLFRGDFKWFFIQIILGYFTMGLSHILFSFIYNRIYIKGLLNKGYQPYNETVEEVLREKGYIA